MRARASDSEHIRPESSKKAGEGWSGSFGFDHVKVLVVGRGPVRKEALEILAAAGAGPSGILLSENDSVVFPRALAPELRLVGRHGRVHRIPDYIGSGTAEKAERIAQIIEIANLHGYTHIFAGYGFMAEDYDFIHAIEKAGLGFVGPCSQVASRAGAKDAAKMLARSLGVSVTPGVDNIAALTLLAQAGHGGEAVFLDEVARHHGLQPDADWVSLPIHERAERLIAAAAANKEDLFSLQELQAQTAKVCGQLIEENPGRRLRLKHVAGGGGKGQRVIGSPGEAAQAVYEVLNESKATAPGANKNFLIELNIESTRHIEIQLLGNGEWCIALGGRDCSLQMHEQKLVEFSITQEMLEKAGEAYRAAGLAPQSEVLREDLALLRKMEQQAENFGQAVGLDSASTFESIVFGNRHHFMEMNTRIQVEHRVTEQVYSLRFRNPAHPREWFDVDSLVEAMLLVAVHGTRLPRPERVTRHVSGAEVRINATNDALQPHAGGIVLDWTPPIADELRDDQGIGIPNPDTGAFMPYHLAGAYDSNAALIVTHGESREDNLIRMAEILRHMEIRGHDVMTNQPFLYGLVHWLLGCDAMARPATPFVRSYLAAVGALARCAGEMDPDIAWQALARRAAEKSSEAARVHAAKTTLILRPLQRLLASPHHLAGWLAPRRRRRWEIVDGHVEWRQNPLDVLDQLYRFLCLEDRPDTSAEERIWAHDQQLLEEGLAFYAELRGRLGTPNGGWPALRERLESATPPKGLSPRLWQAARASHRGHQLGLDLLELPVLVGADAGFYGLRLDDNLEPVIPASFQDEELVPGLHRALAPPPPTRSNQIVAWSGGTFYSRPAPDAEPFVTAGARFQAGDQVGILEVMKMFNPVLAGFGGTITKVLVSGDAGIIVHKGQPLFDVEPDEPLAGDRGEDDPARRREKTMALMERI